MLGDPAGHAGSGLWLRVGRLAQRPRHLHSLSRRVEAPDGVEQVRPEVGAGRAQRRGGGAVRGDAVSRLRWGCRWWGCQYPDRGEMAVAGVLVPGRGGDAGAGAVVAFSNGSCRPCRAGAGAGGGTGSRRQKRKWRSAGPGPAPSWRAEGAPAYRSGGRVCPALPLPPPLRVFLPARGLPGAALGRCSSVHPGPAGSRGARPGPDSSVAGGRQRCFACSIEHIAAPGQRGAVA